MDSASFRLLWCQGNIVLDGAFRQVAVDNEVMFEDMLGVQLYLDILDHGASTGEQP
jgi:hypothetical protein